MFRYAVTNSAPRPESYIDDYNTVHDPTLTDAQAIELCSNFSSRFEANPQLDNAGLRTRTS